MTPAVLVLAVVAGFVAASFLALYSYGRFARRARGAPSFALPVAEPPTALDEAVAAILPDGGDQGAGMMVDGNLDAFAVRAITARRAGRSLDLQYYMWKQDLTGRLLAREIVEAADRGVRVRLLLDDLNAHGHDRTLLALDGHPNIDVRLFNPSRNRAGGLRRGLELALRAVSVTRRMHHKAWIADGRVAVVGGRNIGDAYFDAAASANFRDLDLLLAGPLAWQAETIFDDYWNSEAVIPIGRLARRRAGALSALRRKLAAEAAGERARPYLARVAEDDAVRAFLAGTRPFHRLADARLVSDPPEKVRGHGEESWLFKVVGPMLFSAKCELAVISPYFIPGDAGTERLVALARGGVKVSILTNSLAATDVVAVHGAYARYRRPLLEGGVALFELKPYDGHSDRSLFGSSSASLHTKAFVVDGGEGFIGSMNLDPRSISLNCENGVVFRHAELARELAAVFADQTAPRKSYRLGLRDGALTWRDQAAASVATLRAEPQAGRWRRLSAALIAMLPIQSQL